jgi:hypothetical protein
MLRPRPYTCDSEAESELSLRKNRTTSAQRGYHCLPPRLTVIKTSFSEFAVKLLTSREVLRCSWLPVNLALPCPHHCLLLDGPPLNVSTYASAKASVDHTLASFRAVWLVSSMP